MLFKNIICIAAVFFGVSCTDTGAWAQLKLTALPSKTIVEQNEIFQLQFVLEGGMQTDEFVPPSFRQLEKIGNAVKSNGWTWINGSLTEYMSYTYQLKATATGKVYIASAIAKVKGKLITSKPFSITITDEQTGKKPVTASTNEEKPDYFLAPGEDAKEKIRKNLFIKVLIDKKSCFVGEPVVASFKLYTRLESESKIVKRPSFNGFSVVDMEEPENGMFSKEMLDGKLYNCYLIRKVQLIPLQAGDLIIEPVEVENKVRLIQLEPSAKNKKYWLEELLEKIRKSEITVENIVDEKLSVFTNEETIKVLELPDLNKPQSFTGAVGNYTIQASLDKNEFPASESGVLKIELRGNGNINMLTTPAVQWPAGIEVYEPRITEEFERGISPLQGRKIFEIPFSADEGTYKIPAIEFGFFDVADKTYKLLQTDSLQLTVKRAVIQPVTKTAEPVAAEPEENSFDYTLIGLGTLIILMLVPLVVLLTKRKKAKNVLPKPDVMQHPTERKLPGDFLLQAERTMQSSHNKQFYLLLLEAMNRFFADRMELPDHSLNQPLIFSKLKLRQLDVLAHRYLELARQCEFIVFSPVETNGSKEEFFKSIEEFLKQADERL